MNDAKLKLDAGNLTGAVEEAIKLVKTNPGNATARTFLFELCCFSGEWDRAEKQLDMIGHQDPNAMIGSIIFRQNFKAERDRLALFEKGQRPEFMMGQPGYVAELLKACDLLREGKAEEARAAFDEVEENRPAVSCTINGETYSDMRDYNDMTMCVFEIFFKDSYVWMPMEHVEKINFLPQKSLRDIYWRQAEIELKNGIGGEVFFPALYAGTWRHQDDNVRLGRGVDWRDAGGDVFVGEGTKLFWADSRDKNIFELETIEINVENEAE